MRIRRVKTVIGCKKEKFDEYEMEELEIWLILQMEFYPTIEFRLKLKAKNILYYNLSIYLKI